MPKLRVHNISMSLDGFIAGPCQDIDNPLGVDGGHLHEWVFETRWGRSFIGKDGGTAGIDEDFMVRGVEGIGATIMGRNMFGPLRGDWRGEEWKGWWGATPPFHHDVFVLTHHARKPLVMEGGTTFHFVVDGIEVALRRAIEAAAGKDVRLGGGAEAIRQYLAAGLVDELHIAMVPVFLGRGERLFENLDDLPARYACVDVIQSPSVTHILIARA